MWACMFGANACVCAHADMPACTYRQTYTRKSTYTPAYTPRGACVWFIIGKPKGDPDVTAEAVQEALDHEQQIYGDLALAPGVCMCTCV